MPPGVTGRFDSRHIVLGSPRECTNVVFHPCSVYPFAGCMMRPGNILFDLQALFTAFVPSDPACVTMTLPAATAAAACRLRGTARSYTP